MAKKKAGGKVRQQGNRTGKRLGVKVSGGENVLNGMVLVRQRGTNYHAGTGVETGRDHTLYAIKDGKVEFSQRNGDQYVNVR